MESRPGVTRGAHHWRDIGPHSLSYGLFIHNDSASFKADFKQAVVFAGEDAYITSETESEPEKYPESTKHHGKVFKCHLGVRGGPSYAARIKL